MASRSSNPNPRLRSCCARGAATKRRSTTCSSATPSGSGSGLTAVSRVWARGPADTQDVVQDTLLQVVRKLDAFEPRHEGAFLGYVRQTLRNNITDRIRQARRRGPVEPLGLRRRHPRRRPRRMPSPRSSWTGTMRARASETRPARSHHRAHRASTPLARGRHGAEQAERSSRTNGGEALTGSPGLGDVV